MKIRSVSDAEIKMFLQGKSNAGGSVRKLNYHLLTWNGDKKDKGKMLKLIENDLNLCQNDKLLDQFGDQIQESAL